MKITIVEDNPSDQEKLKALLSSYGKNNSMEIEISSYNNGADFLEDWPMEQDFIFLDVMMVPIDGITTAREIRKSNSEIPLIFITDSATHSLESYSVHAADYLLKPPSEEMIRKLMDRLAGLYLKRKPQILSVKTAEGLEFIDYSRICYVEYRDRKVWIYTDDREICTKDTLQEMESKLSGPFFRIHSAFLVNLKKIQKIQGNDLYIQGKVLPISKHRKKDLLNTLSEYLGETEF